jgi:hypothetical protein
MSNFTALINELDREIRNLADRRYDLQFEIDNINDTLIEKKTMRIYYKTMENMDAGVYTQPLSRQKIQYLNKTPSEISKRRSRSNSPSQQRNTNEFKNKLNYS